MNFMRKAGLSAILLLTLLWLGCGDVFRPVANPILKPGGDPSLFRYAIAINNNNGDFGTTTQVDVSGDTNIGNYFVGKGPVFGLLNTFQTQVYTANFAGDTVSAYSPVAAAGTPANTITLPLGSKPVFLVSGSNGNVYVANSGTNTVGVIPISTSALSTLISVGPNPVALAELPNSSKVYCLNKGNGTVTVIATVDNSVVNPGVAVGRSPVWATVKPDGSAVYVVNQGSNSVSVINTTSDSVMATLPVGASPNFIVYDKHSNRLYVTNTAGNSVSVFDASTTGAPTPLGTVSVGTAPLAVTVLGDGSRAYVVNSGSNNVTVIDATTLTVKTTVTVGENPVFIASSPGDTSRVFVANHGAAGNATYGSVSDIDTSTDTVIATVPTGSPRPVFIVTAQ